MTRREYRRPNRYPYILMKCNPFKPVKDLFWVFWSWTCCGFTGKQTSERSRAEQSCGTRGCNLRVQGVSSQGRSTLTPACYSPLCARVLALRFHSHSGQIPSCEVFRWPAAEASPQHLQSIPHPALASIHPFAVSSGHSRSTCLLRLFLLSLLRPAKKISSPKLSFSTPHHSLRGACRQKWLLGLLLEA